MPGEDVCGDSWASLAERQRHTLFVADGLGHGQDAAEASVEAVRLFHRFDGHQVPTLLDYVHGGCARRAAPRFRSRGSIRQAGGSPFAGVGNVAGALASATGSLQRMVSMPGTAGHNARKIQSFDYPFDQGLIVLASDGKTTRRDSREAQ